MDKPVIAQKKPYSVELEAGKKYMFCTCGKSKDQPFCDLASHKGSGFAPKHFTVDKDGTYYLCGCKHSKNQPFCDGTHKTL
ncbi:MAG: CDGSH iron-sulfur domain-containing protein [Acholeplasmataceae bacterium]